MGIVRPGSCRKEKRLVSCVERGGLPVEIPAASPPGGLLEFWGPELSCVRRHAGFLIWLTFSQGVRDSLSYWREYFKFV